MLRQSLQVGLYRPNKVDAVTDFLLSDVHAHLRKRSKKEIGKVRKQEAGNSSEETNVRLRIDNNVNRPHM